MNLTRESSLHHHTTRRMNNFPRGLISRYVAVQQRRWASSDSAPLSAQKLSVSLTKTPKALQPLNKLVFGQTFTDHMLTIDWAASHGACFTSILAYLPKHTGTGWEAPKIKPYGKLSLDPSSVVFHYGIECFEGMKAYKDAHGRIRLFRPEMNMARFARSCQRLTLPGFDRTELLACIKELLKVEDRWIPDQRGYSLYLRPTAIGTQESLGVGPSNRATIFVIASPVGPYYKTGFAAVSLCATKSYVRAWPGGTGDCKVGLFYSLWSSIDTMRTDRRKLRARDLSPARGCQARVPAEFMALWQGGLYHRGYVQLQCIYAQANT